MKSLKWIYLLSIASAFTLSGCFIDIDEDGFGDSTCLRGSGPVISEELTLNRIDAIDLKLPGTVYLRQGEEQKVVVEAQANIIDYLERTVKGGQWDIEVDRCVRDMEEVRIFITVPELVGITISGAGKVITENEIVGDDIDVGIPGSGSISLVCDADDLNVEITGSGSLSLEGLADEIRYRVSGSGDLKAFKLRARKGEVNISGSGDVEVFVTEELNVFITGSGDVLYQGNPSLNVSISGSGEVIDAN